MKTATLQLKIMFILLSVDAVTKLIAFSYLSPDQPTSPHALLQIVLRFNYLGIGSVDQELLSNIGYDTLLYASIFATLLALLLIMMAYFHLLSRGKILLCIGIAFFIALTVSLLLSYEDIHTTRYLVLMNKASVTFLWIVIWVITTSTWWKIGAFLFASSAIGNLLSLFYAPGIVDFLWSAPLNKAINIGVFNFADILWLLAFPVFLIAAIYSLIALWRTHRSTVGN